MSAGKRNHGTPNTNSYDSSVANLSSYDLKKKIYIYYYLIIGEVKLGTFNNNNNNNNNNNSFIIIISSSSSSSSSVVVVVVVVV